MFFWLKKERVRICDKFNSISWRLYGSISAPIKWSIIKKLGSSRTANLTIFVPFIGYLILFNTNVEKFFQLSQSYINFTQENMIKNVYFSNLIFLYFGLLFIGCGSILYHIFSPTEIKQHDIGVYYVKFMESISTEQIVEYSLDRLLEMYMRSESYGEKYMGFSKLTEFPLDLSGRVYNFAVSVFDSTQLLDGDIDENEAIEEKNENNGPDFYTMSGYVQADEVLKTMYSSAKVLWYYSKPLRSEAVRRRGDVFFLEYEALDYSKFKLRLCVFVLFSSGYLLLAVPTLKTAYSLLKAL